jgi:rhodanese-related sulfurtransferase/rubrerythrin
VSVSDYFKQVSTMTSAEAREFLRGKDPSEYNLVDVRQPKEYERGHLPGARLLPVSELLSRKDELDSGKPVIAYCGSGVRSRAAASMLVTAGFREVYSLEGGMRAWDGLAAIGAPEAGMAFFPEKATVEELIALAWLLEEGTRRFYSELPAIVVDHDAATLFQSLVEAEQHHQETLTGLYRSVTGQAPGAEFPRSLVESGSFGDIMEGGMGVSEALDWARDRKLTDVLDLAIALETNSYDLYGKMSQKGIDTKSREVFFLLSAGEKKHLERLAGLLERKL